MALECKIHHPLQHDGTSQNERFLEALEPGNAPIHQFDLRDWMRFAYHFATRLNYFTVSDAENPDGNWQDFMKAEGEIEEWLKDAALVADEKWLSDDERDRILKRQPKGDYEPHLALFLAFLKLLRFPQNHLNGLSKRHLDFYYSRVLQLSKQPAVPDRVHILFELAKNATSETVPAGTLLDGGKDATGKPLRYATENEITVNAASVALIKSVFHRQGTSVRYAEMTNSVDGLGTEFKDDNPSWNGFGDDAWPAATLGFALASGVLLMKEGERQITVTLDFASSTLQNNDECLGQLQVFLSGEKGWVAARMMYPPDETIPNPSSSKLIFKVAVDTSQQAIVPYDVKIHGERFNTNLPVMRVLINTDKPEGYAVYALFGSTVVTTATIDVDVKGVKNVTLENDHGRLDPSKPFQPFGPLPEKGSSFYIGSTEVFQKEWQSVSLNITWKDKPNLVQHYEGYGRYVSKIKPISYFNGESSFTTIPHSEFKKYVDNESYFAVTTQYLNNNVWHPIGGASTSTPFFAEKITLMRDPADKSAPSPDIPLLLMRKEIDVNKAALRNYLATDQATEERKKPGISARFEVARFNPGFAPLATSTNSFSPAAKSSFIRRTLSNEHGFFHDLYPKILTELMIDRASRRPKHPDSKVPNAPYAPVIASLALDYTATAENAFTFTQPVTCRDAYDNFAARTIQLFHEHPFGQAEQHAFLKQQCDFLDTADQCSITLMPRYAPEGELYIGLKNAQPSGSLNLLLAAVEGSEDPLAAIFKTGQHVAWYSLTNNEWQSLNQNFLVADGTNNLLRPGIVSMNLPPLINTSNTVLDAGCFWLKAQLPQDVQHAAVCRLAAIHTQAVTAVLKDNSNDPSHLDTALPAGTITKVIDKLPLVKGVKQPYGSFCGVLKEKDQAFYLRASERLRHKQRGINIWDYERLVLQQFPSIHKVKCLSHTFIPSNSEEPPYSEMAPGCVSLVVIPDIRNKSLYDPLQPRVNQNTLREIEQFLVPLIGLHVKCIAANPEYETVTLDFRVKFYDRHDANAYCNILKKEIVRYLSPWAFGQCSTIHFGGRLCKSVLIRFIEEREYVDFVSHCKMYHRTSEQDNNMTDRSEIVASSARAILASASEHKIEPIESNRVCDE